MKKAKNKSLQQFQDDKIENLEKVEKTVGGARNNTGTSSADSGTSNPPPELIFP